MKVLFVQNIAGIAGSEKYFLAIIPELMKRDIQCAFLAVYRSTDKKIAQEFCALLKKESIETFECEVSSYSSLKPVFRIRKLQKENAFDIIHSHLIYADFWSALVKKFLDRKITIVSTLHGYQESLYIKYCLTPEKLPRTLYYFLARFSLRTIGHVYACSKGLKEFYEKAGIVNEGTVEVIQHGFDYPEITTSIKKSNGKQLIILGRVIERKGHHFVFQVMPELIRRFPDIKLVIVGDGESENELKSFALKKNIDAHVSFEGYRTNVREYLAASDIVLVPSYAEGLPLVIFEAFSAKKPVIAFDTIGCNEAVKHKENGLLISPFNVNELREGIETLLSDENLRTRMGEKGYADLKGHFSLKRMTDETASFYASIMRVS